MDIPSRLEATLGDLILDIAPTSLVLLSCLHPSPRALYLASWTPPPPLLTYYSASPSPQLQPPCPPGPPLLALPTHLPSLGPRSSTRALAIARALAHSLTHSVFGWVRSHAWAGIDITPFPKLAAWLDRIESRPGAYAGLGVPTRGKKLTKEEEEEKAKEAQAWIMADQKK